MELPQPRPIGTEGKKPTHDFLSLYTHSSFPDQRSSQGNCLKTHDFLQPLERVGIATLGEKTADITKVEKPSPSSSSSPSVEHILPGGIGTYTISHISNINHRGPKTEQTIGTVIRASSAERSGENNKAISSSNSINGGGFAFWEESTAKEKGKKVKDIIVEGHITREPPEKLGQWSSERPLQGPPFHHSSSFNSLSSSSTKQAAAHKSQSFMEMMNSGRGLREDEEDDEEEFANSSKKSTSSHNKDGKSGDQKANTPRSKHSATEQRRRSKINDRFQILRDLIPQNDQKRDKASFLLEVIEYIQYLQEKVNRYDASYRGWNQETMKLTPWRNGSAPSESIVEHSPALKNGPGPALMFTGKFDDNIIPNPMLANTHTPDPGLSTCVIYQAIDQQAEEVNRSSSVPIPLQPNMFPPVAQPHPQPMSEEENMVSQPQSHLWPIRPCTIECPTTSDALNKPEELTIEGGTISLAGVYSQGLLNNLTQALQSLGVDLSQASISVQVDIGKQAISRLNQMAACAKDDDNPSDNRPMTHSRAGSSGEDSDQTRKRLRTE